MDNNSIYHVPNYTPSERSLKPHARPRYANNKQLKASATIKHMLSSTYQGRICSLISFLYGSDDLRSYYNTKFVI